MSYWQIEDGKMKMVEREGFKKKKKKKVKKAVC
jgi:hypothetical protein